MYHIASVFTEITVWIGKLIQMTHDWNRKIKSIETNIFQYSVVQSVKNEELWDKSQVQKTVGLDLKSGVWNWEETSHMSDIEEYKWINISYDLVGTGLAYGLGIFK